jgi:hypothetical protein
MFGLTLNEKNFAVVKEAKESEKPIVVPENIAPPIFLDLNLQYRDLEGSDHNIPYRIKYVFYNNSWSFVIE